MIQQNGKSLPDVTNPMQRIVVTTRIYFIEWYAIMERDHSTNCCALFNIDKITECLLEMVQTVDIRKINFAIIKLRSRFVSREKGITRFWKNGYVATNCSRYKRIRIYANCIS